MYIIPGDVGRHNIRNLIDVPFTALNASVDPTATVCSNHVPMNQSYTVYTAPLRSPLCAAHPALLLLLPRMQKNNQASQKSAINNPH